jgi:deoxycytidylate deaminase
MNNKWHVMALETAKLSPCRKRKVGAILVSHHNDEFEPQVTGRGWNHMPSSLLTALNGTVGSCEDTEGITKPEVIHAEVAAVNNYISYHRGSAGLSECVMYVTHQPCENCLAEINKYGVKEVIVVEDFMKFDTDKLRYDLIPVEATKGLAEVLTYGAKKYKPNNWQGVDDKARYTAALYRHLEAWRAGETVDEESGLSHLSHAITNIAFLLYFEEKQK